MKKNILILTFVFCFIVAAIGYCAAFSKTADALKSDVNTQIDSGKKAVADQKDKLKAIEEAQKKAIEAKKKELKAKEEAQKKAIEAKQKELKKQYEEQKNKVNKATNDAINNVIDAKDNVVDATENFTKKVKNIY